MIDREERDGGIGMKQCDQIGLNFESSRTQKKSKYFVTFCSLRLCIEKT